MVKKKRKVQRKPTQPKSIISDEIHIPNHSGMLDAGKVHRTPTDDLDPVNKKYVDDSGFTGTEGSIPFVAPAGTLTEDNLNLFWNVGRLELEPNLIKITSDGTQASPALKFNDTNTGFFKSGDSVGLSINNSTIMTVDSTGLDMNTHKIINVVDPTANQEAATKKYVDDNSTSPGGNDTEVQFNDGGVFGASDQLTWNDSQLSVANTSGNQILAPSGTADNPGIAFAADIDTGFRLIGGPGIASYAGGEIMTNLFPGAFVFYATGTKTAPVFRQALTANSDSGFFFPTNGTLAFSAGGQSAGFEFLRFNRDIAGSTGRTIFNEDGEDIDFRVESVGEANALFIRGSDGVVALGTAAPQANVGVGNLQLEGGTIVLKEITTPTADAGYAKIYSTSDNELFWQDGAGTEHLLHGDSFSNIWFHNPIHNITPVTVTISTQDAFTKIDSFTVVGKQDDLANAVGSTANNEIVISSIGAGEYEASFHGSITATGGADKEMMLAMGIELAIPLDITDVTDDLVTPIVITSTAHGLEVGDMVEIVGVLVNTAANGSFIVSAKDANTFTIVKLDGTATTGNGDYDQGTPTGDVTILYPGNMVVREEVRGATITGMSVTGLHDVANADKLAIYVANLDGVTDLTVAAISFDAVRVGD